MTVPAQFTAFRIHEDSAGTRAGLETLGLDALSAGEVVIRAAWSSVNYKDALAGTGKGRILRRSPLVGGIDVAGQVVASTDPAYREGDAVLATGCGLSENLDGGYAQYVRLPSRAVIALPATLDLREAMVIGTAGYTAALALLRLEENRQSPSMGPLLVTGATGGVGMLALDIFSRAGYQVHAVSGKADRADFLRSLGASEVLGREFLQTDKPLEAASYGGGLDNAGGALLAGLLARTVPYGNVASAGMAGSPRLDMTVMPFILRGVSLIGIGSSGSARDIREAVWQRLAGDWRPRHLDRICTREIVLADLPLVFDAMLAGQSFGRTVVRLA
ncbi:MAG TPA: acryloyl-CoA reductase [Stenotrophomonas sp.]|jgi:putative YhdH/YhfP family quinone oxidoreductase